MANLKNPRAEILTIGTELLTGSAINTNASYLGRELTGLGFQVHTQVACRDESKSIREALQLALRRSDVIFVSGGLGPTPDDITRESVADFFQVPLVLSQPQYRQILKYYRKRRQRVPAIVKREAYFPANAKPLFNRFGIALGFLIEENGKMIVVLPGVPGELTRLFKTHLKPLFRRKFAKLRPNASLVVKTIGLSEPSVMECLGRSFFKVGDFQFGIYPEVGEVALRIYADSKILIQRLKKRILRVLAGHVYSLSDEPIESVIAEKLRVRRWSLSLAESCTGGQVAELITRVPGASHYFSGGVVAYQNEVKIKTLGVPRDLIQRKGAVSRECALAMAKGVRKHFATSLGVSVTGVAGPTGGSAKKPVGLVYIALATNRNHKVWEERFVGDRRQIQDRAAKKTLEYLWGWVRG